MNTELQINRPFSVYVHIPYCLHRCPYCDFNTYALTSIPEKEYLSALLAELDFRATEDDWKNRQVQSIYFGGGTPSLFSAAAIKQVIYAVSNLFTLKTEAEVTLEANPGTINPESLKDYYTSGVNRISLGAQTFDPDLLKTLGRIHSPEQIEVAVNAARDVGFKNISLDLIYGIPGQDIEKLKFDLKELIRLDPRHISAYGLTIEKGTPFYLKYKKGEFELPSEDEVIEMMTEINSFLPSCGYKRYEISNYAERGYEAKHNLVYWHGGDYLGVGAGAHSLCVAYNGQSRQSARRWANFALPNKYIKECVTHGHAQSWKETLDAEKLMFEFFFLGLRKTEGVSFAEFEIAFGKSIEAVYPSTLHILLDQQLLERENGNLRLSAKGLDLADSVIENFAQPEN